MKFNVVPRPEDNRGRSPEPNPYQEAIDACVLQKGKEADAIEFPPLDKDHTEKYIKRKMREGAAVAGVTIHTRFSGDAKGNVTVTAWATDRIKRVRKTS